MGVLLATMVGWAIPSALAMWLDVERFVHPYAAPGVGDYERDPVFQRVAFLIRFGWLLALTLVAVLGAQILLLKSSSRLAAERDP